MRLIFLLQKQAWFVEHKEAWYRIQNTAEVETALKWLPLNMVNLHDLIEQPHQAGNAKVTQSDERNLSVSLKNCDDQQLEIVKLPLGKNILINLDWITKKFRDGWMTSDARLNVENVGELFFDAYLPPRADSQGKTLTISNDQTGKSSEVWIARNQKTRIALIENGQKGKAAITIRCEPEHTDRTSDPRQLGFILIGEDTRPYKNKFLPERL